MKDERLLEPIKYYDSLRRQLSDALIASFDELKKKTNTDEKANEKFVKEYKENRKLSETAKSSSRLRGILFGFLTAIFIAAIFYLVQTDAPIEFLGLTFQKTNLILPLSIVYLLLSLLFIKLISKFDTKASEHQDKADEAYEKAKASMENISTAFNSKVYLDVVKSLLPSLEFYSVIPYDFYAYLSRISDGRKSDFNEGENDILELYQKISNDPDVATIGVLFGTLEGKPFLFDRQIIFNMGSKTYSGTLTLPYTEYYQDSDGNTETRTSYETLFAYHSEPCPEYSLQTSTLYFTPSAPHLDFNREPFDSGNIGLESYVAKNARKLSRLEKKAIKDGDGSIFLTDKEFEAIFNVKERNNDVEFRMMYTPYVINNTKELILSTEGFGNKFSLYKRGPINMVRSDEIVYFENDLYPFENYVFDYSFSDSKTRFIRGGVIFFRSLYFSLAPLFVVRLNSDGDSMKTYGNTFSPEFIKENYRDSKNAESLLYENISYVKPFGASFDVNTIAKATYKMNVDDVSVFTINSYSFSSESKTAYIYTVGRHVRGNVPVSYYEYFPISEEFYLLSSYIGLPEKFVKNAFADFNGDKLLYKSGFLGLVLSDLDKEGVNRYKIIKEDILGKISEKGVQNGE